MGDTQVNALFRLVERWRRSESINDLFTPMLLDAFPRNVCSSRPLKILVGATNGNYRCSRLTEH
jgi:hypothetical protein